MLSDQPDRHRRTEPLASPELEQQEAQAAGILTRLTHRVHGMRSWVYQRSGVAWIWRVGIAVLGLVVIIVGVILLVLPGPGWLLIFVGLGIWATEFAWARSLLTTVQRAVGTASAWIRRQPRWFTMLASAVGLTIVAAAVVGVWRLAR